MSDYFDDMVSSFYNELLTMREKADFYSKWGKSEGRKSIWTCKNGTKVRVMDMTDSHLNNTIKMLESKDPKHEALRYLKHESFYRFRYQNLLNEIDKYEHIENVCL